MYGPCLSAAKQSNTRKHFTLLYLFHQVDNYVNYNSQFNIWKMLISIKICIPGTEIWTNEHRPGPYNLSSKKDYLTPIGWNRGSVPIDFLFVIDSSFKARIWEYQLLSTCTKQDFFSNSFLPGLWGIISDGIKAYPLANTGKISLKCMLTLGLPQDKQLMPLIWD